MPGRYRAEGYISIFIRFLLCLSLSLYEKAEIILARSRSTKILSHVPGRVKYFFARRIPAISRRYLGRNETKPRKHRSPLYATAEKGKSARHESAPGSKTGSARRMVIAKCFTASVFMPLSRVRLFLGPSIIQAGYTSSFRTNRTWWPYVIWRHVEFFVAVHETFWKRIFPRESLSAILRDITSI